MSTSIIELEEKDSCIIFHDNGEVSINIPAQEGSDVLFPSAAKIMEILLYLNGGCYDDNED